MATKKNLPEIRFKGFEGEWEKVNNNELFKVYPFKPYLTEWTQNDKFEVIQQGDNPIVGFADGKPFENYNGVVLFGDHTLSLYKPTRPFFVASDGLKILGTTNDLNGDYFYTLLQKNKPKSEGYKRHFSILKEITLRITQNVNEQTQIGTYFQHLDSLISLHQRKYDKLLTVKKAMLEKMFPKEGADVPEIRFKGFEGKWEKKKLGEVAESFDYGLNAAAMEYDGANKYIRITDIDDKSRNFKCDDITTPNTDLLLAEKYKLKIGDVLLARTGASVGKSYIYKEKDGLIYFAGFLIRARIKAEFNPNFVFQKTLTYDYSKFIRITSQRSGQPGVNAQEYAEYSFLFPKREEQDKIAIFFQNLDTLITQHQKELDKLKNVKKACLEKMFV